MRPKPKLEVGCWCRLGFLGDLARTWVSLSRLSRPRRGRAARVPAAGALASSTRPRGLRSRPPLRLRRTPPALRAGKHAISGHETEFWHADRAPSPEEGAPPRRKPRSAESAGPMRRRNGADSCQNSDCWPEIASARTWRGKRAACGSGEPAARNRGHANMKGRWGAACWRRSRGVGEDAGEGGCDVPCGDAAALRERGCDVPCGDATAGRDTLCCTVRATRARAQLCGCERAGQRKRHWSESAGTQPCECSGGWGRGQCGCARDLLARALEVPSC